MTDFFKKLTDIQNELKAPKNQFNKFGNYKYRNCEDILEAVKPLLKKHGLCLTLTDDIEIIGGRFYLKASACLIGDGQERTVYAYAREPEIKKGMDESQITGASSSYARKYALNGLFCIDDTKDADSTDNSGTKKQEVKKEEQEISVDDRINAYTEAVIEKIITAENENIILDILQKAEKKLIRYKEHLAKVIKIAEERKAFLKAIEDEKEMMDEIPF